MFLVCSSRAVSGSQSAVRFCGSVGCCRLNLVAEDGGHHHRCANQEQYRPDERHYRLHYAFLAHIYLDVDLQGTDYRHNRCDGIGEVCDIHHHRHHEVVHPGKSLRPHRVVNASTLRRGGKRRDGWQNCSKCPSGVKGGHGLARF